jgi:hypothetical protein
MALAFVSGKSTQSLLRCEPNIRMALLELRMLLSALVMKYSWTGIPDRTDRWDEEMKPFDTGVIHPWNGKCVLKLEPRS